MLYNLWEMFKHLHLGHFFILATFIGMYSPRQSTDRKIPQGLCKTYADKQVCRCMQASKWIASLHQFWNWRLQDQVQTKCIVVLAVPLFGSEDLCQFTEHSLFMKYSKPEGLNALSFDPDTITVLLYAFLQVASKQQQTHATQTISDTREGLTSLF